jgi:hypothetical protein
MLIDSEIIKRLEKQIESGNRIVNIDGEGNNITTGIFRVKDVEHLLKAYNDLLSCIRGNNLKSFNSKE